jgi:ABC-type transport system involved in cytochrome c biogenesis permease subunit
VLKRLAFSFMAAALAAAVVARSWTRTAKDLVLADGEGGAFDSRTEVLLGSFKIPLYPSGKPKQYVSDVVVADAETRELSPARITVNHPLRKNGWWIYQMSFGEDELGRLNTLLRGVRDPLLPLAAVAGILLLAGALLLCFAPSREIPAPRSRLRAALSWTAGAAAVSLPAFIIGRAVLRPEPVPALQSALMAPHVGAYAASCAILLFAAAGIGRRAVPLGFFLMTVGLVVGAVWGKMAWGDWWQFDPKENWSLATWCAFAVHLLLPAKSKWSRVFLWVGAVLLVVTLTWVNFSRFASGLHSYA